MKTLTHSYVLAATNDMWIFGHDIMGAIALFVLLILGFLFHRHRLKDLVNTHGETRVGQKIRRVQLWAVYFLVVGVTIFFFFIYPRATSLESQGEPKTVPSEHAD